MSDIMTSVRVLSEAHNILRRANGMRMNARAALIKCHLNTIRLAGEHPGDAALAEDARLAQEEILKLDTIKKQTPMRDGNVIYISTSAAALAS